MGVYLLSDRAKQTIHLHHTGVSKEPAVSSVTTSLAASSPPDTACQPRPYCSWMDGWSQHQESQRTVDQWSSAPRSLPPL